MRSSLSPLALGLTLGLAVTACKEEPMVAKVNGKIIPRAPFDREYAQTIERYKKANNEVPPPLAERLKDNLVGRMIEAELVRQEAARRSIKLTDEEFATAWADYKKRYQDDAGFKSYLERAGVSEADVKEQLRQNQLAERVFNAVTATIAITDEAASAFYQQNLSAYSEPEQVRASHVLLRVAPTDAADVKAKQKKLAEDVKKQAKGGADFAELAKKHSQDPTAQRGGDLGWFPHDRMVKPFDEAVFALKDDEISDVVETGFGFHVIKRTGYRAASVKSFEEMKKRITDQLRARERNKTIRGAMERWKKEAKIEIVVKGDPAVIASGGGDLKAPGMLKIKPGAQQGNPIEVRPIGRPNTNDQPIAPPH